MNGQSKNIQEIGRRRLLFVVNSPDFFLSHRLPIALKALQESHEVHMATAGRHHGGSVAAQQKG
ncbi:hypothetical protein [Halomonas aquatica]|uniref:Uncharacterized protein n=1 Tax=Halomonas aquatica TaxID=3151123 RepID=A0ABV1NE64_9GAMM